MKLMRVIGACVFLAAPLTPLAAEAGSITCAQYYGAKVVAADGTYLGTVSDKFNEDSIFNTGGKYGNKWGRATLWDNTGKYGDKFSDYSAFNKGAAYPPKLVLGGSKIGVLTTNSFMPGAISLDALKAACQ